MNHRKNVKQSKKQLKALKYEVEKRKKKKK